MKSFKTFTSTPKDENLIVNSHGKHAKIHHDEKEELIVNSHGKHAKIYHDKKLKESNDDQSGNGLASWGDYAKRNHNPHLGETPTAHINKLNETHPIPEDHAAELKEYSSGSGSLTRSFIAAHKAGINPINDYGHNIPRLDAAVSHQLKHDVIVHSGISFDPTKASGHIVSHLSTSTDPKIANEFAEDAAKKSSSGIGHILRIHLKVGQPAGVMGYHSKYPEEHEVLIGRTDSHPNKYHMKINPTPEVYKDRDNMRIIHVHHAELHPTEG